MMAANAQAAYLSDVQGLVLVNNQPVAANTNIEVVPGDRVKAVSGSVKVVYSNGAIVPVAAGDTLVVLANGPAPTASPIPTASPSQVSGATGGYKDDSGYSDYLYIGGGLAVAGGAGLGVALLLQKQNKPASP